MKATIDKLYRDSNLNIWGEATNNKGKVFIEVDSKSARYAKSKYSNVIALKTACEYAPEINKWWVALA